MRLALAPRPLPGEAISSWVARIAARYDVLPYDLARHVLPGEAGYAKMHRLIDSHVAGRLEAALARATRLSQSNCALRRLPGFTAEPRTAWPRRLPAWCPRCVAEDIAQLGEVHVRQECWGGRPRGILCQGLVVNIRT